MARYFFNFLDGKDIPDPVGSEHADIESVRAEAVEVMTEILRGNLLQKEDVSSWMVQVTDEKNNTVLVISLTASVRAITQHSPLIRHYPAELSETYKTPGVMD
jgi:hypothetical protein